MPKRRMTRKRRRPRRNKLRRRVARRKGKRRARMGKIRTARGLYPPKLRLSVRAQTPWLSQSANAGFQGNVKVKLNSLFNPFTFVDNGPGAYNADAELMALLVGDSLTSERPYTNYRVYGCHLKIEVMNTGAYGAVVYRGIADPLPTNGAVAPALVAPMDNVIMQTLPWTEQVLGPIGAMSRPKTVLNRYFNIPKIYGINQAEFWALDVYSAATAANPALTYWWNSYVSDLDNGRLAIAKSVYYRVKATYYVQFEILGRVLPPA